MKTILSSLFIMGVLAFSSFSVNAGNSHLEEAIQHTEAATEADGAKSIAQHAEEARRMQMLLEQRNRTISTFRKV